MPLGHLALEKDEDTEEYLREEWPVEEGEQFSDLGEVEEAAKVLDDIVEAKNDTSLCVRRATGEPYAEFNFSGQYHKKKERKEQLRATLGNIGFSKSCSTTGFLRLGNTLNSSEERALLEGFKGKHFFYMAKMCQLQKDVNLDGFVFDKWESKNDTQPPLDTKEAAADEEVQNNKFTLFGGSFHVKSTEAVKGVILESIAFLQCEEESFTGLSVCNWSVAHNHARYRVAQHLLDCDRREAFTSFCLRQFPKKRQRDEAEDKYEKKKARATVSRSAPSESETISTETYGAIEEKVGEREDIPEWLNEEFQDLSAKTEAKASQDFKPFLFRVFKFFFWLPRLETDYESLKKVVAQMYDTHGKEAIFSIFDWSGKSPQKLEIYHSKRKIETYGVDSHERLIYYEPVPPWKSFPKLKRYEEVTVNLVLENAGIRDEVLLYGKRINERYSYALFKLKKEEPAPKVEEVPKGHHCAPPLGAPPVEEVVEIREPEESPPVFTAETHNQRRNAGTREELDDGEAHYLGFARYGAYAKDWEERHERKAISYKNFLLVFFVSLALALAQLFLVPRMPQFQRWPKKFQWQPALQHLAAIVLALLIAYKATFVRAKPRRDLWLFCLTSALVFWVDTGCVISLCVSPAICCYAASKIMLWHKKKSLAWVPFAFLMAYTALTYESLLQQCLEIVKLFVVVTSFVHEQRRGAAVATVLFSPYRDLLFVVEFPAVYLYEFLEELDLV